MASLGDKLKKKIPNRPAAAAHFNHVRPKSGPAKKTTWLVLHKIH